MHRLAIAAAALLLAACQDTGGPLTPPAAGPSGPSHSARSATIADRYIVVFRPGVQDVAGLARQLTEAHGGSLHFTYQHALEGFAARLPSAAVAALSGHPQVAYVEPDQAMHAVGSQSNATWGLDRIDQRGNTLDGTYNYATTGAGVSAYVIDTGIRLDHSDFGGRAVSGYDAVDGGSADDCHGHGTHVAGTVGGATYGVAKGVRLVAVRVLDCGGSGTTSGVVAGVDWVTANHSKPAVANMSLGGGASTALDEAVQNSIAAGVSYVAAAGNSGRDACGYSPARIADAMTIGATDQTDAKASWSNYGDCVDWFAPGVSITSAWYTSSTATNTISGTSMAAPHVAGVAALYLETNPGASTAAVRTALYDATTKGIVTASSTANNHLLYNQVGGGSTTPTNSPPTAAFSFACADLACSFTDTSTDSDGSIASWSWSFGDNATSTAQHPSHTYAAGGTYTVTLTATDNGGATGTVSQQVTVSAPSGISLTATGYKIKGRWAADLTWTGTTAGGEVWVRRNGSVAATTADDGFYPDRTSEKGSGSVRYQVCETDTGACSNEVTVTY